jgi:hypothetical protein
MGSVCSAPPRKAEASAGERTPTRVPPAPAAPRASGAAAAGAGASRPPAYSLRLPPVETLPSMARSGDAAARAAAEGLPTIVFLPGANDPLAGRPVPPWSLLLGASAPHMFALWACEALGLAQAALLLVAGRVGLAALTAALASGHLLAASLLLVVHARAVRERAAGGADGGVGGVMLTKRAGGAAALPRALVAARWVPVVGPLCLDALAPALACLRALGGPRLRRLTAPVAAGCAAYAHARLEAAAALSLLPQLVAQGALLALVPARLPAPRLALALAFACALALCGRARGLLATGGPFQYWFDAATMGGGLPVDELAAGAVRALALGGVPRGACLDALLLALGAGEGGVGLISVRKQTLAARARADGGEGVALSGAGLRRTEQRGGLLLGLALARGRAASLHAVALRGFDLAKPADAAAAAAALAALAAGAPRLARLGVGCGGNALTLRAAVALVDAVRVRAPHVRSLCGLREGAAVVPAGAPPPPPAALGLGGGGGGGEEDEGSEEGGEDAAAAALASEPVYWLPEPAGGGGVAQPPPQPAREGAAAARRAPQLDVRLAAALDGADGGVWAASASDGPLLAFEFEHGRAGSRALSLALRGGDAPGGGGGGGGGGGRRCCAARGGAASAGLGAEGAAWLAGALRGGRPPGSSLESVALDGCAIGERGAAVLCLAAAERGGGRLRALRLRDDDLGDAAAAGCAALLVDGGAADAEAGRVGRGGLRVLDLAGNGQVGVRGAKALAAALRVSRLRALDLSRTGVGESGVGALAAALADAPSLTTLGLGGCYLSDGAARALAHALGGSGVRALDLSHNRLSSAAAAALARALRGDADVGGGGAAGGCALDSLDLRGNGRVGDDGARALAGACGRVRALDLGACGVGPAGAAELAAAAREPGSALRRLLLDGNAALGADGGAAALAPLVARSSVRTLSLEDVGLGAAGAAELARALEGSRSLGELSLARNGALGDAGAVALARALARNDGLRQLRLDGCAVGAAAVAAWADALERNGTLARLHFRCARQGGRGRATRTARARRPWRVA